MSDVESHEVDELRAEIARLKAELNRAAALVEAIGRTSGWREQMREAREQGQAQLREEIATVTKERDDLKALHERVLGRWTNTSDELTEARAERDKWQTDWELLKSDYQALQRDLVGTYAKIQRLKEEVDELKTTLAVHTDMDPR